MSMYNRIKLDISDLSPESASKVFTFLNSCFENNLSYEYYESKISTFSIEEQYFILYYAKLYFSDFESSFLNTWMKKQIEELGGHEAMLINTFYNLRKNADRLLVKLNLIENTLKRQVRRNKKTGLSIAGQSSICNYRIPLYFEKSSFNSNSSFSNREKFKLKIHDFFTKIMDNEQFELFFNNSFSYSGNLTPIKLLYIEMGDIKNVYIQFYLLYSYYRNERSHQNKVAAAYYKEKIEEKNKQKMTSSELRSKFIQIPKIPTLDKITKLDVMKIMYNTFPQIRESYNKYLLKNPKTTLDSYLNTKSRNLKNT